MVKRKLNIKVIIQSIIALVCVALMYFVSWWFILPVIIILWLNQRELFKKNKD